MSNVTVPPPVAVTVNSGSMSAIDARSSVWPPGIVNVTSTKPRPLISEIATPSPGRGPTSIGVGVDGGSSGTMNSTSWPDALRKPIFRRPYSVRMRIWSGTSARNSTVTSPELTRDRSAYRRPLTEMLSAAKFSLPTTRILPSVENFTITWPLKTSFDV